MTRNEVRIIGGSLRGRKLRFAGGADVRPTLGRVRETLFNWLRPHLADAACLDLFAGSGALGFEALSQGAGHVTFVETNAGAASTLRRNIELLNAHTRATVIRADARRVLTRDNPPGAPFDVVFLDPPFDSNLLDPALAELVAGPLLSASALVYVETPGRQPPPCPAGWRNHKNGKAGDTQFALLGRMPG